MSGVDEVAQAGMRRRPHRASTYFVILVAVLGVAGAVYLWQGVGSTSVYTAARDLPAYHRIGEDDVRRDEVRSSELPQRAVTVRDAVLGHYTLDAVHQDDAYDSAKLGPVLSAGALYGRHVVGLRGSPSDVLNGRLVRGDRIDVLFSPEDPKTGPGTRLPGLLVLDVEKGPGKDGDYVVVLAVAPKDEERLIREGGSARAFFSRVSPG